MFMFSCLLFWSLVMVPVQSCDSLVCVSFSVLYFAISSHHVAIVSRHLLML